MNEASPTTTEREEQTMVDEQIRRLEQDLLDEARKLSLLQAHLLRQVEGLMSSVHLVLLQSSRHGPDTPS